MVQQRMDADTSWHLDKRIPIALIVLILLQSGTAVWFASAISSRVDQLERAQVASAPQTERLIRVETKVDAMHDDINEIKHLIRPPPSPH